MPVRLASPLEWVNIWYIMPQMDPDWRSVHLVASVLSHGWLIALWAVVALKQMSRSLINWFLIHVGPLHSVME